MGRAARAYARFDLAVIGTFAFMLLPIALVLWLLVRQE